jgi:hypothetical protein
MKTKLLKFIAVIFLITFYGCEKDSEIFECETLDNLSGTWYHPVRTVTFNKNHEFIDSVFTYSNRISLGYVIKGEYKLSNGFIEFSNLKFTYLSQMSVIRDLHYQSPTFRFEIIDNKLYLDELCICRPIEHSGYEIGGKWQSTRLIIVYDTEQSPSFLSGNQILEYDFNNETKTYMINYQNNYGVTKENISDGPFDYQFESPYVYANSTKDNFGLLKEGLFLTFSDGERIFTKTP